MTTFSRAILLVWIGVAAPASADEVPPKPADDARRPILSLRLQGDHVFACTTEGLYRATLAEKQWQPLRGKTVPEPGGLFVADPADEKSLLYLVTRGSRRRADPWMRGIEAKKVERPGLYRSTTQGDTWALLSDAHDFDTVVRLPGDRLFALAGLVEDDFKRRVVLLSEDGGRNWKDITNGVADRNPLLFWIRDPDHPTRVCLFSAYTRRSGGTVLQAADDEYRWKAVHHSLHAPDDWLTDEKKTEEEFFDRSAHDHYSVTWLLGKAPKLEEEFPGHTFAEGGSGFSTAGSPLTRLDNYFARPPSTETHMSKYDIVPDKPTYEFRVGQPFNIDVALTHQREEGPGGVFPRLVDAKHAAPFWSIKVVDGDKRKKDLRPVRRDNPFDAPEGGPTLAEALKQHGGWQFLLTPQKPARRRIDLSELQMPQEPGTYRVQLRYDCHWTDDEGTRRYISTMTGGVFTVTVRAKD